MERYGKDDHLDSTIYVLIDGQDQGPFNEAELTEQLERGTINYDSLVWTEGMAEWQPLRMITAPPALPAPPTQSPSPVPPSPPVWPPFQPPPRAPLKSTAQQAFVTESNYSDALGYVLLAIPVVATVLTLFSDRLGLPRYALSICVWIATAYFAGVDAKQLGMGSDADTTPNGKKRSGPRSWAWRILLFWIIGFPSYLYMRSRYGARNLFWPGLAVIVALVVVDAGCYRELPAVDDPDVINTMQSAFREAPEIKRNSDSIGSITISNATEISFDVHRQKRVARADLKSNLGSEVIYYSVEWQNRLIGSWFVRGQEHP